MVLSILYLVLRRLLGPTTGSGDTAKDVAGEPATEDQFCSLGHRVEGQLFFVGRCLPSHENEVRMCRLEINEDALLELPAQLEPPFQRRGGRHRVAGEQGIVLCLDRTHLRDVAALQRDIRNVVARPTIIDRTFDRDSFVRKSRRRVFRLG